MSWQGLSQVQSQDATAGFNVKVCRLLNSQHSSLKFCNSRCYELSFNVEEEGLESPQLSNLHGSTSSHEGVQQTSCGGLSFGDSCEAIILLGIEDVFSRN
jgi:hypothetical protein